MNYTDAQVASAVAAMEKYREGETGEVGAALAVVGLSAERAAKEVQIRDDMIRVAHRAGASLRQLAEVSGLDRKTVTAIVGAGSSAPAGLTVSKRSMAVRSKTTVLDDASTTESLVFLKHGDDGSIGRPTDSARTALRAPRPDRTSR